MAVGYKEYGTCPKVWMIVCVNSGGSPTEGAAKEGLFFLFLNMPAGKNQKQGSPPPRFAQGPEAFQDFATRLAKTAWLLFLCALGCVCCGKRGLAYRCLQCLGHMHIEVGLVECKMDVKKNIILLSHRSCPLLADHHKKTINSGSTPACTTIYIMIQPHFLSIACLGAAGKRQHFEAGTYL